MKRVGLLGGTFNPIHFGHLAIAQRALDELKLQKVILIPSFLPPHKRIPKLISAQHRYNMVKLAIKDHPSFEVSDFEIKRPHKSYTIDTVNYYHSQLPAKAKLYFIIGGDMANELDSWYKIDEILDMVTFVVVDRPGHKHLKRGMSFKSVIMPGVDISSSYIRKCIAQGKSVRYFIPQAIRQYVRKNNFYKT